MSFGLLGRDAGVDRQLQQLRLSLGDDATAEQGGQIVDAGHQRLALLHPLGLLGRQRFIRPRELVQFHPQRLQLLQWGSLFGPGSSS